MKQDMYISTTRKVDEKIHKQLSYWRMKRLQTDSLFKVEEWLGQETYD